jgi:hypothetical protein
VGIIVSQQQGLIHFCPEREFNAEFGKKKSRNGKRKIPECTEEKHQSIKILG